MGMNTNAFVSERQEYLEHIFFNSLLLNVNNARNGISCLHESWIFINIIEFTQSISCRNKLLRKKFPHSILSIALCILELSYAYISRSKQMA